MMMTSTYPNHAPMHPQGIPHGHPMAPGPNPGQPGMAQMQMHPGVSGQNGPVSQAGPMMAGMQPGVGPNAHALSHLQPQQQHHMFAQQQPQMQMNTAHLAQQQQQALRQQAFLRQQHQMMSQQQPHQQNGIPMGFPGNMQGGITPQQMAAMQRGNMGGPQAFVQLPVHLQQAMQQTQHQNQMQQQQATSNPQQAQAAMVAHAQAQAAQQAAQAHQAQQQQQHQQHQQQQQQQHHLQQQHMVAMQHAQSQQSNHSQAGSQGPPTTTQPQQAPLRPPSAIGNGSQQGQASPAPQPPAQQPQQPGPPSLQQPPAPSQPQNMPQQPNHQAQNPQMQQRNPAMGQPQQPQNPLQSQAQARALLYNKQQHIQQNPAPYGNGTLRLLYLINEIGQYNGARELNNLERWHGIVDKYFSESGSLIQILWSATTGATKQFDTIHASLPRYFYTLFNTNVEHLQITMDGATERNVGNETRVVCDRAKLIYTYKATCPAQVVCRGKLTAYWAGSPKLEWLMFEMERHDTFIQRSGVESLFSQPSPSQLSQTQSPRLNKTSAKQRQQQQRLAQQESSEPVLKLSQLPGPEATDLGIPPGLQSFLEVNETMNVMANLMGYYQQNPSLNPGQAMEQWVDQISAKAAMSHQQRMAGNPVPGNLPQNPQLLQQGMQQPQAMPPGARTPSGIGHGPPTQFMSPAMANSLLPNAALNGSPHLMQQNHTPSPASHPMQAQHSQQGSSTTASVNTSPNVTNNKRRRSTAKIEGDDAGGPEVNGLQKVKQSPRVGGNKRAKNG